MQNFLQGIWEDLSNGSELQIRDLLKESLLSKSSKVSATNIRHLKKFESNAIQPQASVDIGKLMKTKFKVPTSEPLVDVYIAKRCLFYNKYKHELELVLVAEDLLTTPMNSLSNIDTLKVILLTEYVCLTSNLYLANPQSLVFMIETMIMDSDEHWDKTLIEYAAIIQARFPTNISEYVKQMQKQVNVQKMHLPLVWSKTDDSSSFDVTKAKEIRYDMFIYMFYECHSLEQWNEFDRVANIYVRKVLGMQKMCVSLEKTTAELNTLFEDTTRASDNQLREFKEWIQTQPYTQTLPQLIAKEYNLVGAHPRLGLIVHQSNETILGMLNALKDRASRVDSYIFFVCILAAQVSWNAVCCYPMFLPEGPRWKLDDRRKLFETIAANLFEQQFYELYGSICCCLRVLE